MQSPSVFCRRTKLNGKEKEHLPLMGIGPVCIAVMAAFTGAGIALVKSGALKSGSIRLSSPLIIAGILCIAGGIALWLAAVIGCRIDIKIKSNQLETCGIYAYVRNPIYSAFLFVCTGALLFCRNLYLLMLPPLFWAYLTVVIKRTEEKWLIEHFGDEYSAYCKKVNRFIPWKPHDA